ncbi:MAG TPA: peroxidase [Deltaproteobacteria bacterium]|nr:peroxidase [Deltaproteobacteria bacterium]
MARSAAGELLEDVVEQLNKIVNWHELPVPVGIVNLIELRNALRDENLHDTSGGGEQDPEPSHIGARHLYARSDDGGYNDLEHVGMGATGAYFGRNVTPDAGHPDLHALMSPNPQLISEAVLARTEFKPVEALNLLAAAWIQFMTHDWFSHADDPSQEHVIPAHRAGASEVRIPHTASADDWAPGAPRPPAYRNRVTHWWDGSQVYGSDTDTIQHLRTGEGGKLRIGPHGRIPRHPQTGTPEAGFTDNWWLGLDLMHSVWVLEHNTVCDHFAARHPQCDDQALFDRARLVISALMAKIHTVEWTTAILGHPTLQLAMNANWWGLQGEQAHQFVGRISDSEVISGIPGSETDHHGAPFQMTEEFVSVYRMHPLLPDEIDLLRLDENVPIGTLSMTDAIFHNTTKVVEQHALEDLFYSFGRAHPGALTLGNYPNWLRNLQLPHGRTIDLAAVDILRDRERGIPRYCAFRRLLRMQVPETFADLTDDPELADTLERVYGGDIEQVDTMVGMFAETPPEGFGFSDTAFRIFILMASRRLKSDRFFTNDYTADVYTQEGLDWIESNTMKSVLIRHFPRLTASLRDVENAFFPWRPTA